MMFNELDQILGKKKREKDNYNKEAEIHLKQFLKADTIHERNKHLMNMYRCRFYSERNDSTALRLLIREIEHTTDDPGIKRLIKGFRRFWHAEPKE